MLWSFQNLQAQLTVISQQLYVSQWWDCGRWVILLHDVCIVLLVWRCTDTKFKQQKLPAWQPIMTAGTVLPVLFAVGVAFIPLGVALLITSNNVCVLPFSIRLLLLLVCNLCKHSWCLWL